MQPGDAVASRMDGVPPCFEVVVDVGGDTAVVLDDQDSHADALSFAPGNRCFRGLAAVAASGCRPGLRWDES